MHDTRGITRESTFTAPKKLLRDFTVGGNLQVANTFTRCGSTDREPACHIQPRITVFLGATMVFLADKTNDAFCKASNTLSKPCNASSGVLPPMMRSSAILATIPSWTKSPMTRHINSSRAASLPGMPMAHLVYTRTPLNGVTMPQYL